MFKNIVLGVILAILILGALMVSAMLTPSAKAGEVEGNTYYSWTNDEGTIFFAGDEKSVPLKYEDVATFGSFDELDVKETRVSPTVTGTTAAATLMSRLRALKHRRSHVARRLSTRITCDGPRTVTHERRDYKERGNKYNSLFYVTSDSCGNELSAIRQVPRTYFRIR